MTTIFWLGLVGLIVFFYFGLLLVAELKALRAILVQMLGSLAEASWRMRDELTEINKRERTSN